MKVVIGIYQIDEECLHRKEQILAYLNAQKSDGHLGDLSLVDLSPQFRIQDDPTRDMQRAADLAKSRAIPKAILLCKKALTAARVAREAGATNEELAIQNQTSIDKISKASLLALGYSFDWESTQKHLDAFIK